MKALVTGGAGFIGCNIADRLAADGHDVTVFDALVRPGVRSNLDWLRANHRQQIDFIQGDVRDAALLTAAAASADVVFHMAAQVAVTTSYADARADFDVNLGGTFNLLEAVRERQTPVIFASTNKVYGGLADVPMQLHDGEWVPADAQLHGYGVPESRPLDFHTPYGCSKGGADQYVLDAARSFGVPTCVLRMSCIYGPRQMGTEDQGWVAHFLIRALERQPITLYGDGRQVRDILDVADAVDGYMAAWAHIGQVSGRAFNLGGGPGNAVSLRKLLAAIGEITGRPVELGYSDWRPGDQKWFVADARAARDALGLGTPRDWRDGVHALAQWLAGARGLAIRP